MMDFVNLKIKPTQFFESSHMSMMCVYRNKCLYMYEYLCLYYISKKT
jgi:hypothetical protein